MSPIEGFALRTDGPQSGLLWVTYSNIAITGKKGTPAWIKGMQSKAKLVDKTICTELVLGTKHYDKKGNILKTHGAIIRSYAAEGGYYIELSSDRRWKLEGLIKHEGIATDGHESNQH